MLRIDELKTGKIYVNPGSFNLFRPTGKFDLDKLCFMRTHDKALHYGREFVAFDHGLMYIDLKEIE